MNILSEISKWRKENLIPEEYLNILEAKYTENYTTSKFNRILSAIGGILFSIGILTYVSLNWGYFDKITKILILFTSFILTYIISIISDIKGYKNISLSFYFIASVFFGINIFFIAQLFNIQTYYSNGLLFWWLFILPLSYITMSKIIITLNYSIFLAWIFDQFIYNIINVTDIDYYNLALIYISFLIFFIVLVNIIMLYIYLKNKYNFNQLSILLTLSVIVIFITLFVKIIVNAYNSYFLTFNKISETNENIIINTYNLLPISTKLFIIFNIILFFILLIKNISILYDKKIKLQTSIIFILFSLIIIVPLISIDIQLLHEFLFFNITIYTSNNLFDTISKILYLVNCIILINIGIKINSRLLTNIGITFCGINIIYMYFSVIHTLANAPILFLGLGSIILLIGFLFDKYNKQLKA